MNRLINYWLLVAGCFLLANCKKDGPENPVSKPVIISGNSGGVYIINEGNFQFGNAKINFYDIATGTISEDLFSTANNRPLGDVCQSVNAFNNKLYVVVNNSGKIEVVDPVTFISSAIITGLPSPRYMLPVSNHKAYVSDYAANAISVVDLSTHTKTGSIPCKGWTEELLMLYGEVFVTNKTGDKLYIINSRTDVITDSITIGYGANSIRQDKYGKLWVLCSGDEQKNLLAGLYKINPVTHSVEQSFVFQKTTDSPWRLRMNSFHDTLYFLNSGVYQMVVGANSLPSTPFIPQENNQFYGLGIEPTSGVVYVSDAIDYVQKGAIYRYKPNGSFINSFKAGIIPGDFYFN